MEKILIDKPSDTEVIVEMHGVSVAESSAQLLQEGRKPSHCMTSMMFAALKLPVLRGDLQNMEYDAKAARFKEYWKILSPAS
jgi:hypothetical protein